jgi:hypothetical protein
MLIVMLVAEPPLLTDAEPPEPEVIDRFHVAVWLQVIVTLA